MLDKIKQRAWAFGLWIRAHAGLVAFAAFVGVYYLWTIRSSRDIGEISGGPGYYNLMADAFLHGHLHLLEEPSKQLLALPNPYDPAQNKDLRLHDLSLYHGHYYPYWGPAPAVVLFAPLKLLGLGISQSAAIFLFSFTGFCFSVAALRELVSRFALNAPRWMLGAAICGLAFGNALPYTLRRPEVYEVALTAGFCFCFIATYFAITAIRADGVSRRRLAAASLFIGLAVASRPTMIFPAIALAGLAIWLWRRDAHEADRGSILAAAIAPVGAIGVLLVAYNVVRFGNPLELGQSYQLAGFEVSKKKPNQVSYVPPGSWYYLFSPPDLTWRFPFIRLPPHPDSYPLGPPHGYNGSEGVAGLLTSVPFTLFAFAGLIVTRGLLRTAIVTLTALALAIMVFASFVLWGATQRYEVDFATFLLIAASLSWIFWSQALAPHARRAISWGGAVLIAWGVVFGVATGMTGIYDSLRGGSPGTYHRLERYTAIIPTIGSKLEGKPITLDATVNFVALRDSDRGNDIGVLRILLANGGTADLTLASGAERSYGLALGGERARKAPPTDSVVVSVLQTGTRQVIAGGSFRPTVIPINLKRGLNHVQISATGPAGSLIKLTGVRLVPLTPIVSAPDD